MTAAHMRRAGDTTRPPVRRLKLADDTTAEPKHEHKRQSASAASARSVIVFKLPGGGWRELDLDSGIEHASAYDPYAAAEALAAAIEAAK